LEKRKTRFNKGKKFVMVSIHRSLPSGEQVGAGKAVVGGGGGGGGEKIDEIMTSAGEGEQGKEVRD